MNDAHSTQHSDQWQRDSQQAQSAWKLKAAIHSPSDPGATLKRCNTVLSLYFDPDIDAVERAAMREEFVRALAPYPQWAIERAFDAWTRNRTRRPSPGEIAILVGQELEPLYAELKKLAPPVPRALEQERPRVTPEQAQRILADAGFAPRRMPGCAQPQRHWTDAVPAGGETPEAIATAREAAGGRA